MLTLTQSFSFSFYIWERDQKSNHWKIVYIMEKVETHGIYLFKTNNGNNKTMYEIRSKLIIDTRKTPLPIPYVFRGCRKRPDVVLVSLLLTVNRFHTVLWCFYCWHWTSKRRLEKVYFKCLDYISLNISCNDGYNYPIYRSPS